MYCRQKEIGRSAEQLFDAGFHCAEAVVAAVLEALQEDEKEAVACASGFGAGLGRTCAEMCGALAGAVIVAGYFYGRSAPEKSWEETATLSAELRQRFIQRHGTTGCGELRQRFGEKDQPMGCCGIVAATAEDLFVILERCREEWEAADRSVPSAGAG